MKKKVIVYVCDNPACRKQTTPENPLEGITIPRVTIRSGDTVTWRKDIYACSGACAGEAIRLALGVRLPKAG